MAGLIGRALAGAGAAVEQAAQREHQAGLLRDLESHKSSLELQRAQTLSELRKGEARYSADLQLEYAPKLAEVEVDKRKRISDEIEKPAAVHTADLNWRNSLATETLRAQNDLERVKENNAAQERIHAADRQSAERRTAMQVNATLSSLRNQGLDLRDTDQGVAVVSLRDGTFKLLRDDNGKPLRSLKDSDAAVKVLGGLGSLAKAAADANDLESARFYTQAARGVAGSLLGGRDVDAPAGGRPATDKDTPFDFDDKTGAVKLRGATIGTARTLDEARALVGRADANARLGPTATVGGDSEPKGLVGRAMGAGAGGTGSILSQINIRDQSAAAAIERANPELARLGQALRVAVSSQSPRMQSEAIGIYQTYHAELQKILAGGPR